MPMSDYVRRLRARVGNAMLVSIGVNGLVEDEQGRLLFQRRGDTGLWTVPGGAIEPGETPADACVREVWEETGLHVEPQAVVGIYGGADYHVTYPNGDELAIVGIIMHCRVIGGTLRADGDETLELAFMDPDDALDLPDMPAHVKKALRLLLKVGLDSTFFFPPTWTPPADGIRKNGMSDFIRDLRAQVGHDLLMSAGAAAIIRDEAGRVLMQLRGDDGRWGLVGGGVDPDENPADAVVREVWEETGLIVEPVRVVGVYSGPDYVITYPNADRVAIVSIVFECRVLAGEPQPDGQESLAIRYFTPQAVLDDPAIPARMRQRVAHAIAAESTPFFSPASWQPPSVL